MSAKPFASVPSEVPSAPKLTLVEKLAYGAGDLGPAVNANITTFFQLIFLTNVAGLPAGLAGSVLTVGKIWDAINDPMIGVLSDKTNSPRWGRRLGWLFYGAVPFGLFSFLLWVVPSFGQGEGRIWLLFWYYVSIGVISQVLYTVVNLPYTALTPELTQDYNERTELTSFRFAFSIGGSILSLVIAQLIFASSLSRELKYLILAAICGLMATAALYWCVFGVRKRAMAFEATRPKSEPATKGAIFNELKVTLMQTLRIFSGIRSIKQFVAIILKIFADYGPFLYVIGIYLFSWLALQLTASILPYFIINWIGLPESQVPIALIGVQGTALLMLFVWSRVSRRYGKKVVYFIGMGFWLIAQAGLFSLQPGQVVWTYILAVIAGLGVSTAYLVPWSMMPDVIEYDELKNGQRREGFFYGFMVLLQKLGLALGLFIVGITLEASGLKSAGPGEALLPTQPESALWAIRLVVGPIPAVLLILGMILTYFYPISREVYAEILLKLSERRRNQQNS